MKFCFTLLFVLVFGASPGFSQKTSKQPPAPVIYQAPDKASLKEFVSREKNFSIVFPGVPKVAKRDMDPAQVTIFSVDRPGSKSIVTVFEFKTDLEDSRERVFELFKSTILNTGKLTVEAERDFRFDGKAVKEFDVSENLMFYKVRLIVSGNRVYELKTDVANWHIISKDNKDRVADYETETKRFFDSFKFNETVKPQPVPVDFLGYIRDTSYVNNFFGFSLDFPANWEVNDPLEAENELNAGLEALRTDEAKFNRALAEAAKKEVIVFGVSNNRGEGQVSENLLVGVLKLPDTRIDAPTLLTSTREFFLQNPNIKVLEDVRNFEKNGVKFSTLTFLTTIQQFKIKQKIYLTVKKGYSITFTLSYIEDEQGKVLEKIFESVKFEQQK